MNRHTSIAALLCAALLSSCDLFEKSAVQDITGPTPTTARIKFHNFSPSSVGVNFFANDVKMSAIGSGRCSAPVAPADTAACRTTGIESATGVVYAGLAATGLYAAITPGQYTLTATMAAKDTIVSTVAQTIEDGKYYSFFMSGIYSTVTKTAEAFIVEDPIPTTIDFAVAHVRLVNAVSNATGDLTLYAINTAVGSVETAVGGALVYKAAGAFVSVPAGTYNLRVRATGAGTDLITRAGVSLVGGRVYTITARGNTATASTLGLDFTQNQR